MKLPSLRIHPPHPRKRLPLEPIEVIEAYGLSHHLACALISIAHSGLQGGGKIELQKAIWYISRFQEQALPFFPEDRVFKKKPESGVLLKEWTLSVSLGQALEFLLEAHEHEDPYLLTLCLKALTQELEETLKKGLPR